MANSLKEVKRQFQRSGKYYTPQELALYMKSFTAGDDSREVYDPAIGAGALVKVFGDQVPKYGQDIDPEGLDQANTIPNINLYQGDTLANPHWITRRFQTIVTNYPFSIKWQPWDSIPLIDMPGGRVIQPPTLPTGSVADYAFIIHVLQMLALDGTAVVMGFPGILYRGNREGKIRQWMVAQNLIDAVISIPAGQFEDTGIATRLLVIKKNKTSNLIRFIDPATETDVTVKPQEVSGYSDGAVSLSPSQFYNPPEPTFKERTGFESPKLLGRTIDESIVNDVSAAINKDRMIVQMTDYMKEKDELDQYDQADLDEFINNLRKVIV